jgi:hypothetical protein
LISEVNDTSGAPPADIVALLVQDRRSTGWLQVIERVEPLRKSKGVLGEDREFERGDDLFDDFVQARRFEYQRPQLVSVVPG